MNSEEEEDFLSSEQQDFEFQAKKIKLENGIAQEIEIEIKDNKYF